MSEPTKAELLLEIKSLEGQVNLWRIKHTQLESETTGLRAREAEWKDRVRDLEHQLGLTSWTGLTPTAPR